MSGFLPGSASSMAGPRRSSGNTGTRVAVLWSPPATAAGSNDVLIWDDGEAKFRALLSLWSNMLDIRAYAYATDYGAVCRQTGRQFDRSLKMSASGDPKIAGIAGGIRPPIQRLKSQSTTESTTLMSTHVTIGK